MNGHVHGRRVSFVAPGGDLMCGIAHSYQVAASRRPITAESFARARRLAVSLVPARAGSVQRLQLPKRVSGYVAIRAIDAAGNVGRPLVFRLR